MAKQREPYSKDLHNVVGGGPDGVDVLVAQHAHEGHAVCLQDPLLQGLEFAVLCDDDPLLVVSLRQVHVHLGHEKESKD